jgi:hypothetical protein
VTAFDADSPSLTYSISGGADAGKFTIDPSTGVLTFVSAPDYENPTDAGANNVYDVQVQVSDGTNTDTQDIAVTVTNVNDNSPSITSDGGGSSSSVSVPENQAAVTTVTASDADGGSLTYSISGGADAGKFTIDSSTGVLTFVTAPDYENPTDAGANNVYDVQVQVSDGTNTDTQDIAVTVTNLNDNSPSITSDGGGSSSSVSVPENQTAVTTVTATDADGGSLTYSISGGADAGKFTIDPSTGVLTFVTAPDYENPTDTGTDNVYDVQVQVSDGTNTDTQNIAVTVTNLNDNAPVIDSNGGGSAATISVPENTTAVTTVSASDADGGTITYSITGGSDAVRFKIDPATGVLTFASAPNFENPLDSDKDNAYLVEVTASDGTNTDVQTITVNVTDVAEGPGPDLFPPVIPPGQAVSYPENSPSTDVLGTVAATDNVIVTGFRFSATGTATSADGFFTIDNAGNVQLTAAGVAAAADDFEALPNSFVYGIQARDAIGNWSAAVNVTLQETNVDDSAPVIDANQVFAYPENTATSANLGTVSASDETGVTGFRFSVTGTNTSPDGFFVVDANGTVHLTAAGAASAADDFETSPNSFTYTLQAGDAAGNWSAPVAVKLNVTDVDDTGPVIPSGQVFGYPENRAAGTVIGQVAAGDSDGVTDFRFADTGTSVSADGFYAIASDGKISLTAAGAAAAANDLESLPNSFTESVQAKDGHGNWSGAVQVTLQEQDLVEPGMTITLLPSSDTGVSDTDRITSDDTPTLRIEVSGAVGDLVTLYSDGVAVGSKVLTAEDVGNGFVDITSTAVGTGVHDFTATLTYGSGAVSTVGPLDVTIDTTPPVFTGVSVDGDTVTITYEEAGSGLAGSPAAGDFSITVDGAVVPATAIHVDPVTHTITLTLGQPVLSSDVVGVAYDPSGTPLQDKAGNPMPGASAIANNLTPEVSPPPPPPPPPPPVPQGFPGIVGSPMDFGLEAPPNVPADFSGFDYVLPITPFTLPDTQGDIFPSLALEFGGTDQVLQDSVHFWNAYKDVLTQPGPGAFRIVVASGGEISLRVFRGIPDQDITGTRTINVQVPLDAFVHTQEAAVIQLSARMATGGPLPSWLMFDATTGKFTGVVPPGAPDQFEIVVEARDKDGRRAEAKFKIHVMGTVAGRSGFADQMRAALHAPDSHIHVLRHLDGTAVQAKASKVAA